MSIASIITRGYIDGVNFIPTRGYSSVSPPVITQVFQPGSKAKNQNLDIIYGIEDQPKNYYDIEILLLNS